MESGGELGQETEQGKAAEIVRNPADCRTLGDGLSTDFLREPKNYAADIKMAERAVKQRWGMSEHKKRNIINRLLGIVDKKSVKALTKDGPCPSEDAADKNAIAAARVLEAIEGQDQKDEHHAEDVQLKRDLAARASANGTTLIQNNLTIGERQPTVQEIVAEMERTGLTERLLEQNELRTVDSHTEGLPDQLGGDLCAECEQGKVGCCEPFEVNRQGDSTDADRSDTTPDRDH